MGVMPCLGYGRFVLSLGLLVLSFGMVPELCAQPSLPVTVRSVEFREARLPTQREEYYEVAIRLRGERVDRAGGSQDFHRLVDVRLEMAFSVGRGQEERQEFYRSTARLVGLASRDEKTVYFYLPPEIVRRDRLIRAPVGWRVSLSVEGEPLRHEQGSYSANLREPTAAQLFLVRVAREAPRNDGFLLPIYLTPFFGETARRLAESPSYVRSEPIAVESRSGVISPLD